MNRKRPNIVWLTVDSIRADHTSVHGYDRQTTPNLERIAASEQGHSFQNCISEGIWSLPVGTSILTGTYPTYHNTCGESDAVPDRLTTFPEMLRDFGYSTYGVSGNPWFSESTSMNRGFDQFEYISKDNLAAAGVLPLIKYIVGLRRHSAGFTLDTSDHCTDFLAYSLVKKWLSKVDKSEPFFIYAHTEGAHTPYYPPDPFVDEFCENISMEPSAAREFTSEINIHEAIAGEVNFSQDEMDAYVAMYDALIKYLDNQIGKVYDTINEIDMGPTILIITSDHGDLLGERNVLSHKITPHDGILKVPMVTHGLNMKTDRIVQHIDFIKQISDQIGLEHEQLQGKTIGNRVSALSYVSQKYFDQTKELVSKYNCNTEFDRFHQKDTYVIRNNEYKYIHSDDKSSLFSLPDESDNIIGNHPEVKNSMANTLSDLLDQVDKDEAGPERSDFGSDMEEQLKDLGYM